jgi:hypothetical protein
MPARLDFKQIATDIDITDVARLLDVKLSKDMRAECCGSDRALQIFPETNSFRCHSASLSGDCISFYAHLKGYDGMYKAAKELSEHFQTTEVAGKVATPPKTEKREPTRQLSKKGAEKSASPFDPEAFAAKLAYTDEVKALDISPEDAERFGIGHYRGKVYFAIRHEDGTVAGFIGHSADGLKLPPSWLPKNNVVKLKRA